MGLSCNFSLQSIHWHNKSGTFRSHHVTSNQNPMKSPMKSPFLRTVYSRSFRWSCRTEPQRRKCRVSKASCGAVTSSETQGARMLKAWVGEWWWKMMGKWTFDDYHTIWFNDSEWFTIMIIKYQHNSGKWMFYDKCHHHSFTISTVEMGE